MPLSRNRLRELVREGRSSNAPGWKRSKTNLEFVYGKSWLPEDKKRVEERDQRAIVVNITKPAVELIVGMLTSNKMDFQAKPLTKQGEAVAMDATYSLKHISILSGLPTLDRHVTFDAVTQGAGWFLVGPYVRDEDPTKEKVQITKLREGDCFFDLEAKELCAQDARYMGHSRWIALKTLTKRYPQFKRELEALAESDDPIVTDTEVYNAPLQTDSVVAIPPLQSWDDASWNLADRNREMDRKKGRVLTTELFYRDTKDSVFIEKIDGTVTMFKPDDVTVLLDPEVVRFFKGPKPIIRKAVLAGPILLEDTEWLGDHYPMVPKFWNRDDKGLPFSFVQQIADQQSEINVTRAKAVWDVNARAIQVTDSYFEEHTQSDLDELKDQVARPDGVIKANFEDVQPWSGQNNPQQLMEVANTTKAEVAQASGITENLAGQDAGKSPKSAEASRQKTLQAGVTFEQHKNDFVDAFSHLGTVLLDQIVKNHPKGWWVRVDDNPLTQGAMKLVNPQDLPHLIEVDAGSFSPTMKDKLFETYSQLISKLPPDAKLQTNALITLFDVLDMPGAKDFEALLKDYSQRLDQQQANPEPMASPAHRPRQKRPAVHPK